MPIRRRLDQAKAHLAETEADTRDRTSLPTGRDDAIHAAQADVAADRAALTNAQWKLDQKRLIAPANAFVFDTLYRPGEYIKDGQPVVSLLPAINIRVRFFVPATKLSAVPIGAKVTIEDSGSKQTLPARVTYISPQAEYSPPELYNRDNREKLLFMIEATPTTTPEKLHPGLPVDVVVDESSSKADEEE